ncbi:MAG: hypothetical protein LBU23_04385 [Planctomycetota bacterium]|jgi:hypothetical protein|nr:hypothetical protein [Planctomycetota bacterium]
MTAVEMMRAAFAKSGHAFDKDDPLMALTVVLDMLKEEAAVNQDAALSKFADRLAEVEADWKRESRETANLILNASLDAGRDAMLRTMREGADLCCEQIRRKVMELIERQEVNHLDYRRIWMVVLAAAGFLLLGGILNLASVVLR